MLYGKLSKKLVLYYLIISSVISNDNTNNLKIYESEDSVVFRMKLHMRNCYFASHSQSHEGAFIFYRITYRSVHRVFN